MTGAYITILVGVLGLYAALGAPSDPIQEARRGLLLGESSDIDIDGVVQRLDLDAFAQLKDADSSQYAALLSAFYDYLYDHFLYPSGGYEPNPSPYVGLLCHIVSEAETRRGDWRAITPAQLCWLHDLLHQHNVFELRDQVADVIPGAKSLFATLNDIALCYRDVHNHRRLLPDMVDSLRRLGVAVPVQFHSQPISDEQLIALFHDAHVAHLLWNPDTLRTLLVEGGLRFHVLNVARSVAPPDVAVFDQAMPYFLSFWQEKDVDGGFPWTFLRDTLRLKSSPTALDFPTFFGMPSITVHFRRRFGAMADDPRLAIDQRLLFLVKSEFPFVDDLFTERYLPAILGALYERSRFSDVFKPLLDERPFGLEHPDAHWFRPYRAALESSLGVYLRRTYAYPIMSLVKSSDLSYSSCIFDRLYPNTFRVVCEATPPSYWLDRLRGALVDVQQSFDLDMFRTLLDELIPAGRHVLDADHHLLRPKVKKVKDKRVLDEIMAMRNAFDELKEANDWTPLPYGSTLLHYAIYYGCANMLDRVLGDPRVEVCAANIDGRTAFDYIGKSWVLRERLSWRGSRCLEVLFNHYDKIKASFAAIQAEVDDPMIMLVDAPSTSLSS